MKRSLLLTLAVAATAACSSPPKSPASTDPPSAPVQTIRAPLAKDAGALGTVSPECAETDACVAQGLCDRQEEDDACYARAEDCAETAACVLQGNCQSVSFINAHLSGGEGSCQPTTDAHCDASIACANEGRCTVTFGDYENRCEARIDADCARSKACTVEGRCKALAGVCVTEAAAVAACQEGQDCRDFGFNCIPIDNRCRNPIAFDCSSTRACSAKNLCGSTEEKRDAEGTPYVACHHTVEHCSAQPECASRGICGVTVSNEDYGAYIKGGCPLADADSCKHDFSFSYCDKTNAGCEASTRCATHGECSADTPSQYCQPADDAHCQASEICKTDGMCRAGQYSSYLVCTK